MNESINDDIGWEMHNALFMHYSQKLVSDFGHLKPYILWWKGPP